LPDQTGCLGQRQVQVLREIDRPQHWCADEGWLIDCVR
jgi:hypothetical protein